MSNNEKYIITQEDAGQRLDSFLTNIYADLSRSFIQKQIKANNVLLNNTPCKSSQIIKTDDIICVNCQIEQKPELTAQNIALNIVYEDAMMMVVNKPSGMLTHPTSTERQNTLVNALLYYTNGQLSTCNGADRPGIVHRLDRNTSGLLMIAKNDESYNYLKEQIQSRSIEKKYYAIVGGQVLSENGTINTNIGRHPNKPEKMAVVNNGKEAITHYKVIERFDRFTLLEINLETGRTHQIRVHMSYIGHPIVNDSMYGNAKIPVKTSEQTLQAFSLKFKSPCDNIQKHIEIPMDNDIIKSLNYLRSKK